MTFGVAIVSLLFVGALCAITRAGRVLGLISLAAGIALSIFQGWN